MEKTLFFTVETVGHLLTPDKKYTHQTHEAAQFPTLEAAMEFARNPNGVPGIHDRTIHEHYSSHGQTYARVAAEGVL